MTVISHSAISRVIGLLDLAPAMDWHTWIFMARKVLSVTCCGRGEHWEDGQARPSPFPAFIP